MDGENDVVDALSQDGYKEWARETLRDHAFRSLEGDPYTDDGGES